jgi:DNA-binding NarL/FixJ family response regulator
MATAGASEEPASTLTEREVEVMQLVQRGLTNKQVAEKLSISPNTVKKHLHNALMKRGIQRRRQLFK